MNTRVSLAGRCLCIGMLALLCGCSEKPATAQAELQSAVTTALQKLGRQPAGLTAPALPQAYAVTGRYVAAEHWMADATRVPAVADALASAIDTPQVSGVLHAITRQLAAPDGYLLRSPAETHPDFPAAVLAQDAPVTTGNAALEQALQTHPLLQQLLLDLCGRSAALRQVIAQVAGDRQDEFLAAVAALVADQSTSGESRWLVSPGLHRLGADFPVDTLREQTVVLLAQLEQQLPALLDEVRDLAGQRWDTPYGRVAIAGADDDQHQGTYLLLIDPGGNDQYTDVAQSLAAGAVSVVIDASGDDQVRWQTGPGPGAGVLGIGLWLDLAGNDRYAGGNFGAGSALFGAGVLLDAAGDDQYTTGSTSLGAAYYGTGVVADLAGNDRYQSALGSQGFGGSGGLGVQLDLAGDDDYDCGHVLLDAGVKRNARHAEPHFISMCQGYGFGVRLKYSGGIGLLIDRAGNDHYAADLFAQGGGYWFAAGLLLDYAGDDRYDCFEHCQGEALHAGGGFLLDLAGNDRYQATEHAQGTGMDHAVGLLYEATGDDRYAAVRQSQGAGLEDNGSGILFDRNGQDRYRAGQQSQGFAGRTAGTAAQGRPIGLLLDLAGADDFLQQGVAEPDAAGRSYGESGLGVDR